MEQKGILVIRQDIGGRVISGGPPPCPGVGSEYSRRRIPQGGRHCTRLYFVRCTPSLLIIWCYRPDPVTRDMCCAPAVLMAARSGGPACLSQIPLTAVRFPLVFSSEAFASLGKTESHIGISRRKMSAIRALLPCIFP